MTLEMTEELREILASNARLSVDAATLTPESDLYEAGMTSHASVNVMLAIEDSFEVEFPDEMLKRSVFESMASILDAVGQLRSEQAA